MGDDARGSRRWAGFAVADLAVFGIFIVNALVFLWAYRFTPLQDYPDWLYQGLLFFKALKGELLSGYYLVGYPVPNSISTFLIGLLDFVFSPEISGKLVFSLDLVLFAAGSIYLLSASDTKKNSFLYYVPLLLIFNFFFFLGYINYYFSMGVLFFGLGYIIRRQQDLRDANIAVLMVLSVLLFFSHAMSYAVFLLYLALLLVSRRDIAAVRNAVLAVLPSLALAFFYAFNHLRHPRLGLPTATKAGLFKIPVFEDSIEYFSIYHRFYPFSRMEDGFVATLNILNHVFCFLVLALSLYGFYYSLRDFRKHRVLTVMIALSTVFFLFGPIYVFGIVKPGERFVFPALWLIMACLIPVFNGFSMQLNRVAKALLLSFFAVQLVFLYGHAGGVARQSAAIYADLKDHVRPGNLGLIYESHFDYEGDYENSFRSVAFMPQYSPVMRLPYYLYTERYLYTPIFLTGIIGNRRLVPAMDSPTAIENMADCYPAQIAIIGDGQGNAVIYELLMQQYRVRFRSKYLLIIERPAEKHH